MTDATPGGFPDTPGPEATPQQDADVRALLAFLRDEPAEMPADVAARLDAVLAEERRAAAARGAGGPLDGSAGGTGSGSATPVAPVTVLPTRPERRGPSTRTLAVLGGVAAAVLAVVGGVALLGGAGGGSSSSSTASGVAGSTTRISASGTAYAPATLTAQVTALVAAVRAEGGVDAQATPATPSAATPAPFGAATGGTAHPAPLTADAAAGCVRALTDGASSTALAVDSGSYQGQPAVVVVIPTKGDPTSLDVFVVRPDCGPGSTTIREFRHIPVS